MSLSFDFEAEATKAALLYLSFRQLPNFDNQRAAMLLFLADRHHLLRFGRPITADGYTAHPSGPEGDNFQNCWKQIFSTSSPPIFNRNALSQSDIESLDIVLKEHGCLPIDELANLTRSTSAWRLAREANPHCDTPRMRFDDFFADSPQLAGLLRELQQDQAIQQAFSLNS